MPKPVRIWLIAAAAIAAAAAGALALLADADALRGPLERELAQRLQRPVRFGQLAIEYLPPALSMANLVIEHPAGFAPAGQAAKNPMLEAKRLRVRVALWPLLRREVRVMSLELDAPRLELVQAGSGKWNYEMPGQEPGPPAALDTIAVRDGTLGVTRGGRRDEYKRIAAALRGGWGGAPGKLELKVRLDASGSDVLLRADLKAGERGGTDVRGRVEVRSDRLKEALAAEFDAGYAGGNVQLRSAAARLGSLSAEAAGTASSSKLNLKVRSAKAPLRDLLRVAGLFGARLPEGFDAQGEVDVDLEVRGAPASPAYLGTVTASEARISARELREPVRASALRIRFTPERLETNSFRVETGRTQLTAQGEVTGYQGAQPQAEVRLRAADARLEELLGIAAAYGVRPEGISGQGAVSLDATLRRAGRRWTYSGSGSLADVELSLPALPKPLAVRRARATLAGERVALEDVEAALGATRLSGSATIAGFEKPVIEFRAAIDNFDGGAIREWRTKRTPANGGFELADVSARGGVTVGKLSLDQIVLTEVKATVSLTRGVLRLDPVSGGFCGGQVAGAITADVNATPVKYTLRTRLSNVETGQLLAAVSSLRGLSGPLSGDADLQFGAGDPAQLASSLNGSLRFSMGRGRLEGLNLLNEVTAIAKFLGYARREVPYTDIVKLEGSFAVLNGSATTKDLRAEFDGGSLSAVGSLGLADEKLNLRATAILTREFLERSGAGAPGGDRVGGWLTTALGNQQGELVVPALITGSFGAPRFAPDAEQVARLKLQGVVPSGGKAILEILTGKPPAEGAKPEGLGGLIDRLRKKPEKKP